MAPSDTLLLQNILDRMAAMDAKIDTIAEKQAIISEKVDSHIKSSEPATKSSFSNILGVLKTWVLPIAITIFLMGRQSVEISKPIAQYPPKAVVSSQVDDTFVANKNKKIDSVLLAKILKGITP